MNSDNVVKCHAIRWNTAQALDVVESLIGSKSNNSAYKQFAFKQNTSKLLSLQLEQIQRRLGVRIRELRLKHGWTQDEMADHAGFHRAQIGTFERGESNITLASLHLLATTFSIRIVDLFRGVED